MVKVVDGNIEIKETDAAKLYFNLSRKSIFDLSPLQYLPSTLQTLNLRGNEIKDISPLRNLHSTLQVLNLSKNRIVDISPLRHLPSSLRALHLANNFIKDISPLQRLPSGLHHLDLSNNSIRDVFRLIDLIAYNSHLLLFTHRNPLHRENEDDIEKRMKDPLRKTRGLVLVLLSAVFVPRIGKKSPFGKIHAAIARDLFSNLLTL